MFDKRFFAEGAAILILAILCATVANAMASRERKLAMIGNYPKATVVPERVADPVPLLELETITDPALPAAELPVTTTTAADSEVAGENPAAQIPTAAQKQAATQIPATTPGATARSQSTPATTPPQSVRPAAPPKSFPPTPDQAFVEISSDDAWQLYQQKAVFLDARRTAVYEAGHIAGARLMPIWESDIDERIKTLFYELPNQQQPIVVYCSGGNCEDSHMLADKLWGVGYENVLVYKDGYPDWTGKGRPTAKGPAGR